MTRPTADDIFDRVLAIECQVDVTRFRLDGVDLWWQIREHLVIGGYRLVDGVPADHGHISRLLAKIPVVAKQFGRKSLGDREVRVTGHRRSSAGRADAIVLSDASNRRLRRAGRWYDVFLDPVADVIEAKGLQTRPYVLDRSGVRREPGYRPAESLSTLTARLYLSAVARAWRLPIPQTFVAEYRALSALLATLGPGPQVPSLAALRVEAAYLSVLKQWWGGQLRLVCPRVVFMAPYASYPGRALCLAARECGVPTVDVQHGVQGRLHPAYARFPVVPGGFNVMPTHFLTWTDADRDEIGAWGTASGVQAITAGNSLLEECLSDGPLASDIDREVRERGVLAADDVRILVTLAWWGLMPEEILEAIRLAPPSYRFLVRLHPGASGDHGRRMAAQLAHAPYRDRCEWQQTSDLPLYGILRQVRAHLTQASSVVLEAERFGIGSVVTGTRGRDYFGAQIAAGTVEVAFTPETILAALARAVAQRTPPRPSAEGANRLSEAISLLLTASAPVPRDTAEATGLGAVS